MTQRNVLIVDDEVNVVNSLKRTLRNEPYDLVTAHNGKEALDLIKTRDIHVVVTDLNMKEMGGLELLKGIINIKPETIRLVLSARSDTQTILEALNDGKIYRYIIKPWNPGELRVTIKQAMDLFNLQQERRDLLKELEQHNEKLQQTVIKRTQQLLAAESSAELGKYTSQIVHNLNTPLNGIMGSLEMVEMEMDDNPPDMGEIKELVGLARTSSVELAKIISGILIHARDETNFQNDRIDLNQVIEKENQFFDMDPVYKYEIRKQLELRDDIPLIEGNPIQIKQILDNLIKNSIDAMEDSSAKELTIKTDMEDGMISISVADTGKGISKEDLPKIFSSEFTSKPVGKGTGLGLASVKTMVESYSGHITVESEEGEGTIITIKLPKQRFRLNGEIL